MNITGTVKVSRTFREIFGGTQEATFSYLSELNALILNGKGLFIANLEITEYGLSFLFLANDQVVTVRNGKIVPTEIIYQVYREYLLCLANVKTVHLSSLCSLWKL